MRLKILVLLGAMLAFMAFGAACGGDDKLSADDYYKKLQTLAQDVDKKISDAQNKTPESQDPSALKDFISKTFADNLAVVEDATKQLDGFQPPDDVKPKHDAFVTALKAETDALKKIKEQIDNTEPDQLESVLSSLDTSSATQASNAACAALQDDAKSHNITVDLKCN